MPRKKTSFKIFSSNSSDAPWSRTFFQHNISHHQKKITLWEISSDLIKRAGEGKKNTLLIQQQNYPERLQTGLLTGFLPAVISFMTHPKSMSRQHLELGLCLFLQCIGCQKREQILVLRFSSASFWVSTIPGRCSSTNSFHA